MKHIEGENKVTATKRPWKASRSWIDDSKGRRVAVIAGDARSMSEDVANANLIVRAVNSFDAMVETAQAVKDWYEGRTHNGPAERTAMYEKAIAALESAGESL